MDQDPQNNPFSDTPPTPPEQAPADPTPVSVNGAPLETPVQPIPTPQAIQPQPVAQSTPASSEDPGKTLGIIGIVLDIIGFSLIGLILGIISRKKSKAAGHPATLGTIAMVLGIVFIVIGVVVGGVIALLTITAGQGLQERASQAAAEENAAIVVEKAEIYPTFSGNNSLSYPSTIADFEKNPESSLKNNPDLTARVTDTTPTDTSTVEYKRCSDGAAQVSYYDPISHHVVIKALGSASSTVAC